MAEHIDGRRYPHDADNEARLYEDRNGRLWVTHEELLKCGYINLSDFDVVYLNGRFYELQAYVRRAGGWWVEEIDPEAASEDLAGTPEVHSGEPT